MLRRPPRPTPFPYTTLFRSLAELDHGRADLNPAARRQVGAADVEIDIELVARIRPTVSIPRHRRRCPRVHRSEEHTSELQSPYDLVCRLLLEKKNHQLRVHF